jgi:hypothetical protein
MHRSRYVYMLAQAVKVIKFLERLQSSRCAAFNLNPPWSM